MFKNATICRIASLPTGFDFEDKLQDHAFVACSASQEKSVGWVPPRGHEHGLLMETVDGQRILKLMVETRTVPSDAVKRRTAERVAEIEAATGRKPGRKETKEISEDTRMSMLPMAFSKVSATLVWIDAENKLVVIDSASQAKTDEVLTSLVSAWDGLALQLVNALQSPASAMAQWLVEKEPPAGFSVDRECELKAADESKAVVRYTRHALDNDEVAEHITMGKMPTRLAMTWDSKVSFVLTEALTIRKIEILDIVFEGGDYNKADVFDADVAIFTGNFQLLIKDLFAALGGEVQ